MFFFSWKNVEVIIFFVSRSHFFFAWRWTLLAVDSLCKGYVFAFWFTHRFYNWRPISKQRQHTFLCTAVNQDNFCRFLKIVSSTGFKKIWGLFCIGPNPILATVVIIEIFEGLFESLTIEGYWHQFAVGAVNFGTRMKLVALELLVRRVLFKWSPALYNYEIKRLKELFKLGHFEEL